MSPELETLDQLIGGSMPIHVIRQVFANDVRFVPAVLAMLQQGDIRMLDENHTEIPSWQWHDILKSIISVESICKFQFEITDQGVSRIN